MDKNICIYNKTHSLDNIIKLNIKDLLFYKGHVYTVYYGNLYNPPFFNIIVFPDIDSLDENYIMCWNMVLLNGCLIIPKNKIK